MCVCVCVCVCVYAWYVYICDGDCQSRAGRCSVYVAQSVSHLCILHLQSPSLRASTLLPYWSTRSVGPAQIGLLERVSLEQGMGMYVYIYVWGYVYVISVQYN